LVGEDAHDAAAAMQRRLATIQGSQFGQGGEGAIMGGGAMGAGLEGGKSVGLPGSGRVGLGGKRRGSKDIGSSLSSLGGISEKASDDQIL